MPTRAVEDYLKCILLEQQERAEARVSTGRIAQGLGVTPGTVTAMVQALGEEGLVDYEPYGGVRLSDHGRRQALHVLRRHRLIELFLVEVLGYDWSEVHDEAERLEHAVSDRLVDRIDEMLGRPAVDPHGDPIPTAEGEVAAPSIAPLAVAAAGDRLRVARVTDQAAGFLKWIDVAGLAPGAVLRVADRDETAGIISLALTSGEILAVGLQAAGKILVTVERAQPRGVKRARK